jgi:hypothetical protein
MNKNDDSLESQLRRVAREERPLFSRELHGRVISRIAWEKARTRWKWRALAAAAMIAVGIGLFWLNRPVTEPVQIAEQTVPQPLVIPDLSLNVAGIVYAQLWPPQIGVELPIVVSLPPEASPAVKQDFPGTPEWLLARLEEPSAGAQAALASALPPEARLLITAAGWWGDRGE